MARITDSILEGTKAYDRYSETIDLRHGGMQGPLPRIGSVDTSGNYVDEWVGNQDYVSNNSIPIVIRTPGFFDLLPDSDKWIETFKALIELHPQAITGLNSGLTVEVSETTIGGGGESQASYTDVKRTPSALNIVWKEKAGKAIGKFFDTFIRYGMMDPDLKKPLVASLVTDWTKIGGIYTPDFYTATILFIEPDVTQHYVVDAWMVTNAFPKGNGERTGGRDMKTAGEGKDISIDWAGITLANEGTFVLARDILGRLTSLQSAISEQDITLPANDIDTNVNSKDVGFNEQDKGIPDRKPKASSGN